MFDARVKLYMNGSQNENRRDKSSESYRNLLLRMNNMSVSEKYDGCGTDNLLLVKTKSVEMQHEEEPEFPDDDSYHFASTPLSSLRLAEKAAEKTAGDVLSKQ